MFMMSILMTTLLSGKFFTCDVTMAGLSQAEVDLLIHDKWDCLNLGGEWVEPDMNFDNTLAGMLTLFVFQSREGWIDLMWTSVDATSVD